MKIEIKFVRSQAAPSPRKKTLMRIAALLALLALVLAIPASAKYVGEGSAVFSTTLDSLDTSSFALKSDVKDLIAVKSPIEKTVSGNVTTLNLDASDAGKVLVSTAADTWAERNVRNITSGAVTASTAATTAIPPNSGTAAQTGRGPLQNADNSAIDRTEIPTINTVLNVIYPVGSIYMSISHVHPDILFPGTTWTAWSQGRTVLGFGQWTTALGNPTTDQPNFNAVNGSGNNTMLSSAAIANTTVMPRGTYRHLLVSSELASHTHTTSGLGNSVMVQNGNYYGVNSYDTMNRPSSSAGSDFYHNNLPPYTTVYMWRRTG